MKRNFYLNAYIHFQLPGTLEMFEAKEYHHRETKTILIAYRPDNENDYGVSEPISKGMLKFIKNSYKPLAVIVRTNAGIELHSTEVKTGHWNDIKIEKVLRENVFNI